MPDILLNQDNDAIDLEYTYPRAPETFTRVKPHDFETAEIARLTAQLDAARAEYLAVYDTLPAFLADRLVRLGVILEVR